MTITLTREEAQQVLDAFETIFGLKQSAIDIPATVETLRARLAHPLPNYSKAGFGQPQREWQGLTDEEIEKLASKCWFGGVSHGQEKFARAIEAKLKEKNYG